VNCMARSGLYHSRPASIRSHSFIHHSYPTALAVSFLLLIQLPHRATTFDLERKAVWLTPISSHECCLLTFRPTKFNLFHLSLCLSTVAFRFVDLSIKRIWMNEWRLYSVVVADIISLFDDSLLIDWFLLRLMHAL